MSIAQALVVATRSAEEPCWACSPSGAKQLVPIANRPILFHGLDALAGAGVARATIAVDAETGPSIRGAVGDGAAFGLAVDYADCAPGAGLEAALAATRRRVAGGPVLVEPADMLLRDCVGPHLEAFADEGLDTLALRLEGPSPGGYVLSERAVAMLLRPHAGADPLARVRGHGGQVRVQDVDGCRPCWGDQDALLEANRRMLERLCAAPAARVAARPGVQGPVLVHPTAVVERSLIRGPAIVGAGARVTGSYVGPYTAVGDDAVIEGSEVEHSILLERADIRYLGGRLDSSIIGRGARLVRSFELSDTLRLAVGPGTSIAFP